jgi:hypothetical protein
MDCFQFKSNILAFSEGFLSDELRHSSYLHLSACNSCNRLLAEFNSLQDVIAREKTAEPNPFAATRILQRLESEFERPANPASVIFIRVLQPVAIAVALLCGILIGSYTANRESVPANNIASTSENIEFLRSNLFITEFADEDKLLVLNK